MTLSFGIYAGGQAVDPTGRPDRPDRVTAALHDLGVPIVRGYLHYSDADPGTLQAPPAPWQYATGGRRLDLVVCFREPGADLTGWLRYLENRLRLLCPSSFCFRSWASLAATAWRGLGSA